MNSKKDINKLVKLHLANDLKRRFDDNTEFAKELDDIKNISKSYFDKEGYIVKDAEND